MVRFPATSLPQMIRVAKEEGRIRSCQLTRSKLPRPSHFHTSLLVKRRSLSLRPLLQSTDWGLSDLFGATSFKADDQDGRHEEGINAHTDNDQGGFKTCTHTKRGSLSKLRSATAFNAMWGVLTSHKVAISTMTINLECNSRVGRRKNCVSLYNMRELS